MAPERSVLQERGKNICCYDWHDLPTPKEDQWTITRNGSGESVRVFHKFLPEFVATDVRGSDEDDRPLLVRSREVEGDLFVREDFFSVIICEEKRSTVTLNSTPFPL